MTDDSWVQPFLQSLAATGIVSRACEAACVTRARVMARKAKDADFAAGFEDAMEQAVDMAESEAWRRAIKGVTRIVMHKGIPVWQVKRVAQLDPDTLEPTGEFRFEHVLDDNGQPIPYVEHEYSDALLGRILGAHRKAYSTERTEITGADGGALKIDSGKRAERMQALMAMAASRRDEARRLEAMAGEHGDIA